MTDVRVRCPHCGEYTIIRIEVCDHGTYSCSNSKCNKNFYAEASIFVSEGREN